MLLRSIARRYAIVLWLLPAAALLPLIPIPQRAASQEYGWPEEPVDEGSSDWTEPQGDFNSACFIRPSDLAADVEAVTQQVVQLANWVERPEGALSAMVRSFGPQLVANLSPRPWPELNERSQLAKVPVLMYHDILPEKEVFFDVTYEEFEAHLQMIDEMGITPISMDQLVSHLRTGLPLPEKPVLLTFDDGYRGHYEHVFPLLEEYGYPGLFSIYTFKVGRDHGRPGMNWAQVQEMAESPLVTIAAHSVNHPSDLREVSDGDLRMEVEQSKRELEEKLGTPIHYFTYPEGNYDERVAQVVQEAGFLAALTMDNWEDRFAGESQNLLAVDRIGQSQIAWALEEAWGGPPAAAWGSTFDFQAPVQKAEVMVEEVPLSLFYGGKPVTIHADSRYQVNEIIAGTDIVAAVDGGFFSMQYLDSNVMIGPVYSRSTRQFIPGDPGENPLLNGRPLVLISDQDIQFMPFDAAKHNTLAGLREEMPGVADAFVAAAWLVKDGLPQSPESFNGLFDFDAPRHRAFWGVNRAGQPVIGVTHDRIDAIYLGETLAQYGLREVVMLDSGASTSLAYQGESLMGYIPRPVPHVVGLVPPEISSQQGCGMTTERIDGEREG
ncbi:MAG: polysaccharide deacetylase family protein [Cyanobacteria bacterium P01_A01_bin.135]